MRGSKDAGEKTLKPRAEEKDLVLRFGPAHVDYMQGTDFLSREKL